MTLSELSHKELILLFDDRKKALLEVRNEIDRRDRENGKPSVNVDFTKYVGDGGEEDS